MARDPFLRLLERDAIVACGAMAVMAWALRRGNPDAAIGVLAGGVLSAISYGAIQGAVGAMTGGLSGVGRPRRRWWALVKFFTRYAMLGLTAYVMIARLRLHAVGVMAGASSLVIGATVEAIRAARPASRPGHPKGVETADSISDAPEFHGKA